MHTPPATRPPAIGPMRNDMEGSGGFGEGRNRPRRREIRFPILGVFRLLLVPP